MSALYEALCDLSNAHAERVRNIERKDSGGRDATADEEIGYEAAYIDAAARHAERFDAGDLADVIADDAAPILEAVKAGNQAEVGRLICAAYLAHIDQLAKVAAA